MDNLDGDLGDLEKKLGVRKGFISAILDGDDWSFIIKLHALVEAAATHLLLFHLQEPELADVLARLELSNKTTGKTAVLGKLGLMGRHRRRCVAKLSELRNSLVHDVRNADFRFQEWVATLTKPQLQAFTEAFTPAETMLREMRPPLGPRPKDPAERSTQIEALLDLARTEPKTLVWHGVRDVLISMSEMEGYSEYRQWQKARVVLDDDEG